MIDKPDDRLSEGEAAIVAGERCPICELIDCEHSDEEKLVVASRRARGDEEIRLAHDPRTQSRQVRAARKSATIAERDLERLLELDWGRRIAFRMLSDAHVFGSSYVRGNGEALAIAFAEGERNVGQAWMAAMRAAAPKNFLMMLAEHWNSGDEK